MDKTEIEQIIRQQIELRLGEHLPVFKHEVESDLRSEMGRRTESLHTQLRETQSQVDRVTSHFESETKLVAMKLSALQDAISELAVSLKGDGNNTLPLRVTLLEREVIALKACRESSESTFQKVWLQLVPVVASILTLGAGWLIYLAVTHGAAP